jgi:RNA polymerase sigma factor (sigma-70 family)
VSERCESVLEDRFLVRRLRRGDEAALCRIYEKHRDALLRLAVSLLNDPAGAEDVVHDVFAAFIRQAKQFQLTGSLKSYLATCVANRARNTNRTGRMRSAVPLDEAAGAVAQGQRPDGCDPDRFRGGDGEKATRCSFRQTLKKRAAGSTRGPAFLCASRFWIPVRGNGGPAALYW